jgi:hypothetical protein
MMMRLERPRAPAFRRRWWLGCSLAATALGACGYGDSLSIGVADAGVGVLVENQCSSTILAAAGVTRERVLTRLTGGPTDVATGSLVEVAVVVPAYSTLPQSLFVAVMTPELSDPFVTELGVDRGGRLIGVDRFIVEPDCTSVRTVEETESDG